MPITAFSSVSDGLDSNRRDRGHPALIVFMVEGGLIYLDKPAKGGFAAYEDGFTMLEICRKYYREANLDVHQLDSLIR